MAEIIVTNTTQSSNWNAEMEQNVMLHFYFALKKVFTVNKIHVLEFLCKIDIELIRFHQTQLTQTSVNLLYKVKESCIPLKN